MTAEALGAYEKQYPLMDPLLVSPQTLLQLLQQNISSFNYINHITKLFIQASTFQIKGEMYLKT
jgi:hypothetical protein